MKSMTRISLRLAAAALLGLMGYALPAAAGDVTACILWCEQTANECMAGCPAPGEGGRPRCMMECRTQYMNCGNLCMLLPN
jgi:hypothetical protein